MPAVVAFLIFVVCLVIAIPVSISLSVVSVLPGAFDPSFTASGSYVIRSMLGGLDSFPLLAVLMFVLSGILMARGGISRRLFNVFAWFMGDKTAGMPCAVIVICLFYGAISGSAPATVAGGLGVIIPGILIGLLLMVYSIYYSRKHGEDEEKKRKLVGELKEKGFGNVMKESTLALLSPVIILGCIYSGIASPTEAAVISVFYALIVSMAVYRSIRLSDLKAIMVEALRTFAPILFILAASVAFSRVLTLMQVPQGVSDWILEKFTNKIVLLLVINLFLLLVGMVMDTTPAILILTPILMPVVTAAGVAPVHFSSRPCRVCVG